MNKRQILIVIIITTWMITSLGVEGQEIDEIDDADIIDFDESPSIIDPSPSIGPVTTEIIGLVTPKIMKAKIGFVRKVCL